MTRSTQHHLLDELVAAGRLSTAEAEAVRAAPRFVLAVRELVSYLAGLIVLVGVIRLIAAVLEDASKLAIAAVLYVAALVAGVVAWRLHPRPGAWGRLAEVLELAALASGGVAIGLTLADLDMRGEWSAVIAAGLVTVWALARLRSSQFVTALALPIGVLVVAGQVASIVNWNEELGSIPIMIGGAVLIAVGLTRVHLAFIVRAVGAVAILGSCSALAGGRSGLDGLLPGLILGAGLFALGSTRMWIDLIVPGGALVVISISVFIFRHVDNDVLQGVLVVLVGLLVLAATTLAVRRGRRRTSVPR